MTHWGTFAACCADMHAEGQRVRSFKSLMKISLIYKVAFDIYDTCRNVYLWTCLSGTTYVGWLSCAHVSVHRPDILSFHIVAWGSSGCKLDVEVISRSRSWLLSRRLPAEVCSALHNSTDWLLNTILLSRSRSFWWTSPTIVVVTQSTPLSLIYTREQIRAKGDGYILVKKHYLCVDHGHHDWCFRPKLKHNGKTCIRVGGDMSVPWIWRTKHPPSVTRRSEYGE